MANCSLIAKRVFLYPVAFIFSIFGTISFLLIYILQFIPCAIYRLLVFIIAKCVYPDAKILSGADNILARGSVYTSKEWYLSVNMILEGKLDLDSYSKDLANKVIKRRLPNGKLKFPELQHFVQSFMGYSFYMPDRNFNMQNHVKLYTENGMEKVNKKKFHKIREKFISKLFMETRSPWEVLIINNYQLDNENENTNEKEYSIVIFKVHHCLGDGYATVNAFFEPFGKISKLGIPKFGSNILTRFLATVNSYFYFLVWFAKFPFHFIYKPKKVFDINSWHDKIQKKDVEFCLWSPKPVDKNLIKEISHKNNVSITSVLISACAGGFRRLMEAKGLQAPKNIRVCLSHNLAKTSNKLTNNSGGTFFDIPITSSSNKSKSQLLKKTNMNMITALGMTYNVLSYIYRGLIKFSPVSFKCGSGSKKSTPIATMGISSVPMPSFDVQWAGCKLLEIYSNLELVNVSVAVEVTILKYKNHFFVTFGIQQTLLESEQIYDIEKYFYEELDYLKRGSLFV